MSHKIFWVCALFAVQVCAADPDADREKALLDRIERLEKRIGDLEAKLAQAPGPSATARIAPASSPSSSSEPAAAAPRGPTVNFTFDGYYGYNFNAPIGRANLLRAYDVLSNAFSVNQAAVVIESAPDLSRGKRFGARLDLQWGQATETLQGNPANEPRPGVYRNIFQAYGTYIIPLGSGITVDFGKWASSLGFENNYSKDQINYSRSFWFNFLPFYHMGVRVNYKLSDKIAANYWVTNGTQQTEPFNAFKDEYFGIALQPRKTLSWNVAYYLGQEHPDVMYFPNGGAPPDLPTLQGLPFKPIRPAPDGRLHIFDSYASWQASPKLTLAIEGDYVIERLWRYSAPARTYGGAAYTRYQVTPKVALAGRAEYLADRGGLFSGATQALKETTITTEYKFGEGFLMRGEWRRDFSNHPFFLTSTLGILKKEQNTATVGLVWWFGDKEGPW